jgi:hypothetical protein
LIYPAVGENLLMILGEARLTFLFSAGLGDDGSFSASASRSFS